MRSLAHAAESDRILVDESVRKMGEGLLEGCSDLLTYRKLLTAYSNQLCAQFLTKVVSNNYWYRLAFKLLFFLLCSECKL